MAPGSLDRLAGSNGDFDLRASPASFFGFAPVTIRSMKSSADAPRALAAASPAFLKSASLMLFSNFL